MPGSGEPWSGCATGKATESPRLLDRHPLAIAIEEEPQPGALLGRKEADAAVSRQRAGGVEEIPEPRFVPPLRLRVEGMGPLVLGLDAEDRQLMLHDSCLGYSSDYRV